MAISSRRIDDGESPEEAIVRETYEEVGLKKKSNKDN